MPPITQVLTAILSLNKVYGTQLIESPLRFDVSPRQLETVEATRCSEKSVEFLYESLVNASHGCTSKSSYDWDGNTDPTDAQRAGLCECDLKAFQVPKCTLKKQQYVVTVTQHIPFVFNCTGKTAPATTEVTVSNSWTPSTQLPSSSSKDTDDVILKGCTGQQMIDFVASLELHSSGCTASSSYNWSGTMDPTTQQYEQICGCNIDTFSIPSCNLVKGTVTVTLDTHYKWVLESCSILAVATPSPTTIGESKGMNTAVIGGIIVGVVVVFAIVGFMAIKIIRKRKQHADCMTPSQEHFQSPPEYHLAAIANTPQRNSKSKPNIRPSAASTAASSPRGSIPDGNKQHKAGRPTDMSKWIDPMIIAMRIPHDAIFFGSILSRGAYGEVYRGVYKGETVAIKQLLPERRKDMGQIEDFLGEAKLMSNLEHERIVKFIGVAWNSLSDACMVVEYMANGDLRSVLNRWNNGEESRSTGFDADKVKIALHVAHALVYLHSLQPVVVHRDLKSRNILLDGNMDAKLTDFGVSRERADFTMTAGVGSSLWIAPEVLIGDRYDEKADIFSFGVVLSELDTHESPYFHAKEGSSGVKLPETAILQQVMLGRLSVAFSDPDAQLANLGRECVAIDPNNRPTTAQVLHRIHLVFRQFAELI